MKVREHLFLFGWTGAAGCFVERGVSKKRKKGKIRKTATFDKRNGGRKPMRGNEETTREEKKRRSDERKRREETARRNDERKRRVETARGNGERREVSTRGAMGRIDEANDEKKR